MEDAADLKSATSREVCGFESLPRHHSGFLPAGVRFCRPLT